MPVVSTVDPVLATAPSDWLVGLSPYEHVLPDWVTDTVLPATVTDPERLTDSVLAATENVAVPLPSPELPVPAVIQETLLVVDQAQPAVVVTVVDPAPAVAPTVIDVGDTV